ncbi:MAG: hypothetical protein P8M11_11640 [Planctomycetota bacterium]|nr:hypothetical protein [Planctomycetota bacterium]
MALCAPTTAALIVLLQAFTTGGPGAVPVLEAKPPRPRGLALGAVPPIEPGATSQGAPAAVADMAALLAEITRAPRVVGTAGYERGLDAVEATLRAAGLNPTRLEVDATRAIPTRSEVLLFEDAISGLAFAGLKERWDPSAAPAAALPAAYAWNVSKSNTRGPVVDLGAGLEADFEAATRMRLSLGGAIALVTVPAAPSSRKSTVRAIAERAASRGCVGVLIAPLAPGLSRDDFVLEDTSGSPRSGTAATRLSLPCAPIRSVEAEMLRSRLKVRRVRGASGKTVTVRVGPGPVEASLIIECPSEAVSASALRLDVPTTRAGGVHLVPTDHCADLPLGGAPTVAVAVTAAAGLGAPDSGATLSMVFGPRDGALPTELGPPALLLDAVLAPRAGSPLLARHGRLGPSRLAAHLGEFDSQLADRLKGQLEARMAAAVDWISYGITGTDDPRSASGARASRGLERLLAPLPSER